MRGYVKLDITDAEWWPAIVQPSPLGGYDVFIDGLMLRGVSTENVRIKDESHD